MKNKTLVLILLLILPIVTYGQEVVNNQDKELAAAYGKKFPGYYITSDGTRTDCLIQFEKAGDLNFYNAALSTSKTYAGETELVQKSDLDAFFVNERLYVPAIIKGNKQWVHVKYQGAIQRFGRAAYMSENTDKELTITYDEEKQVNVASMETTTVYEGYWTEISNVQKLDQEPEEPILINKSKVMEYVVDNDDLWKKIKDKEKGYKPSLAVIPGAEPFPDKMFAHYNKWYDANNPGKITYYPQSATYKSPDSPGSSGAVMAVVAADVASSNEPHLAPRIDEFKGRPTAAGAAVASAKPEVVVKKESFIDRLNRIKADGNKVGVLVTSENLVVNPGTFSEGITKAMIRGSYGPLEGLDQLAKTTTDRLNEGFGVDVFEAVDYSLIPVKEGKYGKLDDWWSTKYKVIVLYSLKPNYTAYYKTVNSESNEREFQAQMKVISEMIVMSAEAEKPDKLKYVTSSPKPWGYYKSEMYKASADTDLSIIQELRGVINPPADDVVIQAIIDSQKEDLDKFVKKKSK